MLGARAGVAHPPETHERGLDRVVLGGAARAQHHVEAHSASSAGSSTISMSRTCKALVRAPVSSFARSSKSPFGQADALLPAEHRPMSGHVRAPAAGALRLWIGAMEGDGAV
jgi:hypothetical protein